MSSKLIYQILFKNLKISDSETNCSVSIGIGFTLKYFDFGPLLLLVPKKQESSSSLCIQP